MATEDPMTPAPEGPGPGDFDEDALKAVIVE